MRRLELRCHTMRCCDVLRCDAVRCNVARCEFARCDIMLCYVMSCSVMLCCVVLWCVVFCCVLFRFVGLFCSSLVLFSFLCVSPVLLGSALGCFMWMRDGGNGTQESSLLGTLAWSSRSFPCGGVQAFRGLPPLS